MESQAIQRTQDVPGWTLRERLRAIQTFAAGCAVGFTGLVIMVMVAAKICYGTQFRGLTTLFYQSFPPLRWAWPWLPAGDGEITPAAMILNAPFLLAIFLAVLGATFTASARRYLSVIGEAERNCRVAGLIDRRSGSSYKQSIGPISASGDVTIQQIADANRELENWRDSFWKGPIGLLIITVIAIIVGAIITNVTGLTH